MLHGLRSSALLFRKKTGWLRKLNKELLFKYIDAPLPLDQELHDNESEEHGSAEPVYAWFVHKKENKPESISQALCNSSSCWACSPVSIGQFEQALSHIRDMVEDTKPVCIVSFSQGATVALIAILLELLGAPSCFNGVQSLVLASPWVPHPCCNSSPEFGYPSFNNAVADVLLQAQQAKLSSIYRELPYRVLVLYGSADTITPQSGIEYLSSICPFFSYLKHPNGHLIPTAEPVRSTLREVFAAAASATT